MNGIIINSIKFLHSEGGYVTEFSKYKTRFNIRYEVICRIRYEYLEVNDLTEMKVDEINCLQVTDDGFFFLFCSNCTSKIDKKNDGIVCETSDFSYLIFSNTSCHNILDNFNYCIHCVKAS